MDIKDNKPNECLVTDDNKAEVVETVKTLVNNLTNENLDAVWKLANRLLGKQHGIELNF
jgi:hypothetical protein